MSGASCAALQRAQTPAAGDYRAPVWLPGGHLQTLYPALKPPPRVRLERLRWDTPDGDFIDLDWAGPPDAERLLVLFHGLEGSSDSHYARAIAGQALDAGWRCVVPHFRGCSGEINRLPRAYHSGDSAEIDWILRRVQAGDARKSVHAVGVSLGGNALLKWLGEQGTDAARVIARAAAVSAPLDLAASGRALARGFNRVYTRVFLRSMQRKSAAKLALFPGLFDGQAMLAARTLYEFDNVVTAPLHGFRDSDEYWAKASCWPLLSRIRVPSLVLNAQNDPFLPAAALHAAVAPLERARPAADSLVLEFPASGGHAGFPSGALRDRRGWLAGRILNFFSPTR